MPALQSLVITDRQTTPVNFTLLPAKVENGVGTVALADSSGALVTERRVSIGQRRSGDRIRTTLKLRVPVIVTETINGVAEPKVAREAFVDVTFNFSSSHSEAERNDVVGMFQSAFATNKPLVHDTIVKQQAVW